LDNFAKNVCCEKPRITVKGQGSLTWNVDFFSVIVKKIWYVVKGVYAKEFILALYREFAKALTETIEGGTALTKFCKTRFLSRISMVRKYFAVLRKILQPVFVSPALRKWLEKQPPAIRARYTKAKRIVLDEELADSIEVFLRVLEPVERMVRMFDNKRGAFLGIVYKLCLDYYSSLRQPIEGLPEAVRRRQARLFLARWEYFHNPILTAAYMLHPRYCLHVFDVEQKTDLRLYVKQAQTLEHPYAAIMSDHTNFLNAVSGESYELNKEQAFSETALIMAPFAWFGDL
jgi:hypothetical protein